MDYFKSIPVHMDFEGQHAAEKFSRIIITLFGIVGLIWGYAIQQFSQTVYILASGFFLASILTIPPWPMYRRKPLNWQPAREGDAASTTKSKKKK
ncbi:signal peptidase complex subunit 1 [Dendroctonus ponderosae]|uniref:Signal peptidase complex subunit 1 n=1 Tax=Dendroctonus ponderosae TaxID=77166 RepID=A0AAR5P3I4_DENPD|nr:signal peptidase complex subunit 1 [Dendroctonus ponderosae]